MAQFQQVRPAQVQFPGQLGGGLALQYPPQDQDDLAGPLVGALEEGVGEGVEDAPALATAVVQDRIPAPAVNMQAGTTPALRAGQPVGMQDLHQPVVAGLLVQ